jgi:superfamily II DNA/RNA helicase
MIERALRPAMPSQAASVPSVGAGKRGPQFLILAPTRELALQIETELRKYAPPAVTSLAVYGGTPIERHYRALRHFPKVVVGTPGRLLDLAGSGHLYLGAVTWLVMDEADQMLDRGFLRDIQRILTLLSPGRQTLLFSATFSAEIQQLASSMQRNPARISVDPGISSPTTISHAYYVVPAEQSRTQLVHTLLQALKGGERSMIFCDQKYKVRRLAAKLGGETASVGAITGPARAHARCLSSGTADISGGHRCGGPGTRYPGCGAGHSLRTAGQSKFVRASCRSDWSCGKGRRHLSHSVSG